MVWSEGDCAVPRRGAVATYVTITPSVGTVGRRKSKSADPFGSVGVERSLVRKEIAYVRKTIRYRSIMKTEGWGS